MLKWVVIMALVINSIIAIAAIPYNEKFKGNTKCLGELREIIYWNWNWVLVQSV